MNLIKSHLTPLFILLSGALLYFYGLGTHDFWGTTESRTGEIIREMLESKDWVIPHLNGKPRLTKPPLYFWTVAVLAKLTNHSAVNELLARIPSAFCAMMTLLLTFLLCKKLTDEKTALISALILATTGRFFMQARTASLDMMVVMLTTAGALFFIYALHAGASRKKWYYLAMHVSISLAFLTKGPVAVVIPWFGIITYLFLTKQMKELKSMHWIAALIIFLLIMLPWGYAVVSRINTAFRVLYHETLVRYTNTYDHEEPFWFYFISLPGNLLPWGLIIPFLIWDIYKNKKTAPYTFSISFFVPSLILLTLCGSKRSYYLMPLYPYVAIAFALFIFRIPQLSFFSEKIKGIIRKRTGGIAFYMFLLFVFFGCFVFSVCFYSVNNSKYSAADFCNKLNRILPENAVLMTYQYSKPYLVYYLKRQLPSIETQQELEQILARDTDTYVLMKEKDLLKFSNLTVQIVCRYPNFTKSKNHMVLIKR